MVRLSLVLCAVSVLLPYAGAQPLPGTAPLDWTGEIDVRMMDGAHRFVEREIAESVRSRQRHWQRDVTSPAAYVQSIAANRQRFVEKIGAADALLSPRMERFGDDDNPALVAETSAYRVYQVRWPVLDGVDGEGLLIEPAQAPAAFVVALGDADQTPEQIAGLAPGVDSQHQTARLLAEAGCRVLAPVLVNRATTAAGRPDIRMTDQPHREWIYRQAFHMGRHIIGYEVQKVRAAIAWSRKNNPQLRTGVAGYAEGGLLAFYAAAADPRIDAVWVGGYFESRQKVWAEPIYRNVWGLLEEFGDAEIASLVAPRGLVVEHRAPPQWQSTKGNITAPARDDIMREFERIDEFAPRALQTRSFAENTPQAMSSFLEILRVPATAKPPTNTAAKDRRRGFDPEDRQRRTVKQLETHVQSLVRASERTRAEFFLMKAAPELKPGAWSTKRRHPTVDPAPFLAKVPEYRRYFAKESMGEFDEPLLPPNPRTRQIYDREKWTGHEVVLDVWPDVFAWGILLTPKDLKPGERRPVVVCQHGRNGLPRDAIELPGNAYNQFAAQLADLGYVVFVPHNLYRGEDRYRWLSRKANTIKASLFSFIIGQHDQILRWLETLPFVDGARMAFYGLSYGGETAVRVPSVLEKYALSICSGDFNSWTRKVAATDEPFSFMYTIEWEMPYFNLGSTFDYSEMTYLIFPRPFMVERGHHDLVAHDRWVAYEYAKTRWLYTQFDFADRTAVEYFNGGHAINGEGTFRFLAEHLRWPRGQPAN